MKDNMKLEDLVRRADELIEQAQTVLGTRYPLQHGEERVKVESFSGLRTSILSFLMKTFGRDHPYYEEVNSQVSMARPWHVETAIGILRAVRSELAGGWLYTTKGLVSAEIFADFLEMAEYLLSEGYKDPAAVMIGSVLEEHLRQLCSVNKIDVEIVQPTKVIPKKADTLNADL